MHAKPKPKPKPKPKRKPAAQGVAVAVARATPAFEGLSHNLREVIRAGRQQALRAVDVVQARTCWAVGHHVVEFEQGGAARAAYGRGLLDRLARHLTAEFGKGFDARNLRHMRSFYQVFPNWNALRSELSWTHYRTLLRVEEAAARQWDMNEAVAQI